MEERRVLQLLYLTVTLISTTLPSPQASVQSNVTAAEGSHALLPCEADLNKGGIKVVRWSKFNRPGSAVTIFSFTDGHKNSGDRVALQDEHMKDGNFNITMKNVTLSDSGTYTCDVVQVDINDKATKIKTSSSVSLSVVPPGHTRGPGEDGDKQDGDKQDGVRTDRKNGGHDDWIAVVIFVAVAVVAVVRQRCKKK